MNNEFKQINNGNEIRYVLEDGGTVTTGAIATVEKPLGELQRRTEPPKPRNFVAKNAKMGGAGQHKDKKKAEKQGNTKHKKPFMESEANVSDRELDTIDPQDQGEEEGSFVKNQIHTMLRVLTHLEHAIGDDEDLPEWVEMKLSQAQEMVVGVMDYMISDKEREVERQTGGHSLMKEQGVAEDPYFNMLERSVSQAQHNLMVGVAHNPQFAQKVKVKQSVGKEFSDADKGHDIKALPVRVPKKK